MSSKSDMGETIGTIHPETKVLSSCETVNQTSYILPTYRGGTSRGLTFPLQENKYQMEEKGDGS